MVKGPVFKELSEPLEFDGHHELLLQPARPVATKMSKRKGGYLIQVRQGNVAVDTVAALVFANPKMVQRMVQAYLGERLVNVLAVEPVIADGKAVYVKALYTMKQPVH